MGLGFWLSVTFGFLLGVGTPIKSSVARQKP